MEALQSLKNVLSRKDFENKFKPASREMEYIRIKSHKKQGFWIFKSHVYELEELLESSHFSRIDSIIEKIGDDVRIWEKRSQLSLADKYIYNDCKGKFDDELHALKREIHERNYTWWENFYKAFDGFIELVIGKLPNVSYLFFPISTIEFVYNLLSGNKEKPKLPPGA